MLHFIALLVSGLVHAQFGKVKASGLFTTSSPLKTASHFDLRYVTRTLVNLESSNFADPARVYCYVKSSSALTYAKPPLGSITQTISTQTMADKDAGTPRVFLYRHGTLVVDQQRSTLLHNREA